MSGWRVEVKMEVVDGPFSGLIFWRSAGLFLCGLTRDAAIFEASRLKIRGLGVRIRKMFR